MRTQEEILSRMWFILWCHGVPANMGVVATFVYNYEFFAVRREVMNGMLDPTAYLIANNVIQIPMMFMFGLSSLGLSAYCIMDYNQAHFGELLLIYALTMFVWESVAQMLSVAFDNPLLGMLQYVQVTLMQFSSKPLDPTYKLSSTSLTSRHLSSPFSISVPPCSSGSLPSCLTASSCRSSKSSGRSAFSHTCFHTATPSAAPCAASSSTTPTACTSGRRCATRLQTAIAIMSGAAWVHRY